MTYVFVYDSLTRPKWVKNLVAQSGETLTVELVFENTADRDSLTLADVYEHLENLVQYIKDKSSMLSYVKLGESPSPDGWHLAGGWAEIEWANQESLKWWEWAYYNDAFDTEPETE